MFDARYFAFMVFAALLVISPGATLAVVTEAAIGEGRRSAFFTVAGVGIGNSTLALASALGMSVVFARWPSALHAVRTAGAIYLAYLGLRGLWLAFGPKGGVGRVPATGAGSTAGTRHDGGRQAVRPGDLAAVARGVMTNLLNPPVILFYMTVLPQFIGPRDPFLERFLVLGATHVLMSVAWLTCYAAALGVLADQFARPLVRRALEGATGIVLVGLGARLFLG
jgi:threonine/homoserine/homoserine lactone efflux protein